MSQKISPSRADENRLVDALLNAMRKRAGDWAFTGYRLKDRQSGVELWVSNGRFALKIYEPVETPYFRLLNRWRLWPVARKLIRAHTSGPETTAIIDKIIGDLQAPPKAT